MSQITFDQIDLIGITGQQNAKTFDHIAGKSFASRIITGSIGAATFTPDVSLGGIFVITCTASTATIANPINLPVTAPQGGNTSNGLEITMRLLNSSGGAITISFGSQYKVGTFGQPASTKSRVGTFYWDGTSWWANGFSADL